MIENLVPNIFWKYFNELSKIPRCSNHEEKAAKFVVMTVKKLGHVPVMDSVGNVLIKVPPSPGYEENPPVCVLAHLDMVCEKNADVDHNFTTDPLDIHIDGEYVTARGTTLGADCGVGVAILLTLIEDPECIHPPLELLFTVNEEAGMTGAIGLKNEALTARKLINTDSVMEGVAYIGSAGSGDSELYLPVMKKPTPGEGLYLKVHGLKGGHSGVDIHLGRANAIKLLVKLLYRVLESETIELAGIFGGDKRNAIPREAEAIISVKNKEKVKEILKKSLMEYRTEYEGKEDRIELEISETPVKEVLDAGEKVIRLLMALPHGVQAMNAQIPELVDTSVNLAVVNTSEAQVEIYLKIRSLILSAREEVRRAIKALGQLAGVRIQQNIGLPPWTPNFNSEILKKAKETYRELYDTDLEAMAIHGGLESAIIGDKFPGMDMISIGVTIKDAHSPDERVHISSVEKYYRFLKALLRNL